MMRRRGALAAWVLVLGLFQEADSLVQGKHRLVRTTTRISGRGACSMTAVESEGPYSEASGLVRGVGSRARRHPATIAVPAGLALLSSGSMQVAVWCAAFCAVWQATLGDKESRARLTERWKADPVTHGLVTPLSAAFVGWLTNWVGVEMLFSPLHWFGIPPPPGLRRFGRKALASGEMQPFGWLIGWQGIVPAKAPRMARDLVQVVTGRLLSVEEILGKLDVEELAKRIVPVVPDLARDTLRGLVPSRLLWNGALAARRGLGPEHSEFLKAQTLHLARGVASDLKRVGHKCLDLETLCVNGLTGPNVAELVALFKRVGRVELRLLVNSGATVGLFLGILQSVIQLCLAGKYGGETKDRPQKLWVSLLGSGVVGCVTNWIALLWIFQPVEPQRILFGLVTLQGCFLKRQKEVSADFAKFFVEKILTSKNMLQDCLLTGANAKNFTPLLRRRLAHFARSAASTIAPGAAGVAANTAILDSATEELRKQLPGHLIPSGVYEYADSAFDLERTISTRMAALPSRDFERLLHPIFEEDEMTLIAVGGLLGVLAAFLQAKLSDAEFRGGLKRRWSATAGRVRKVIRRPPKEDTTPDDSTPPAAL